jgi:hypothetical protein
VKHARAKPSIEASRLNMPIATPLPLVLITSRSIGSPPPSGFQLMVIVPAPGK